MCLAPYMSASCTQTERTVFTNDSGWGVAPVICYESIYGDYVADYIRNGANVIFIVTNHGWWGNTPGHRQHLQYASLRAIETRKDIARSANTGISAFIDQKGMIHQATSYWEPAVIRQDVLFNDYTTFYIRYGDIIGRVCILLAIVTLLITIISKFTGNFYFRRSKMR